MSGPLDRVAERYLNDPLFHAVVAQLEKLIIDLELSPHEVREAAMYACMRIEMRYPRAFDIQGHPADGPWGPSGR